MTKFSVNDPFHMILILFRGCQNPEIKLKINAEILKKDEYKHTNRHMAAIQMMWVCGTMAYAPRVASEYSFTDLGKKDS